MTAPATAALAPSSASLPRRLGAIVYDALLLTALLMVATALFLPFTHGEAITAHDHPVLVWAYRATLVALTAGFYGTFWTRRGQTLGMAAWRLRIERQDGRLPGWRDAVVRLAAAVLSWLPAGLGYWWMLVDRERLTWHDRLSGTRIVLLSEGGAARP
jgi:uncharacterized RDD family membrane protein YckC